MSTAGPPVFRTEYMSTARSSSVQHGVHVNCQVLQCSAQSTCQLQVLLCWARSTCQLLSPPVFRTEHMSTARSSGVQYGVHVYFQVPLCLARSTCQLLSPPVFSTEHMSTARSSSIQHGGHVNLQVLQCSAWSTCQLPGPTVLHSQNKSLTCCLWSNCCMYNTYPNRISILRNSDICLNLHQVKICATFIFLHSLGPTRMKTT